MEKVRIIARSSILSRLQMQRVKSCIEQKWPGIEVEILTRESRGDQLQEIPLQTVEGTDFFTSEISTSLASGEADIAVHSLKDMSAAHFFGNHHFAVVDREETRDVVIFNKEVIQKLKRGEGIIIGTCSPRREEMATVFLQKALPQLRNAVRITTKSIRGNVETRLKKLDKKEYDGTILAIAGLNRLLDGEGESGMVHALLEDKLKMILPLIECTPAPCQGAIVAECHPSNAKAVAILNTINQTELYEDCVTEKSIARNYGTGCLQKFGVSTIHFGKEKVTYAAGVDEKGESFSHWYGLADPPGNNQSLFSSTDYMGVFFDYHFLNEEIFPDEPVLFFATEKSYQKNALTDLSGKRIWVAGTRTWQALAKKGIWVEGCADALGLESLSPLFQSKLINIRKEEVCVLTNTVASHHWSGKGWKAIGTYVLADHPDSEIMTKIQQADFVFWTSYRQFNQYRHLVKKDAIHACPFGETSELLKENGIQPFIFPTIKSFQQWRNYSTRSTNVA